MKAISFYIGVVSLFAIFVSPVTAECGDGDCQVGAFGTGGENSDGKAQGFRFSGEGQFGHIDSTGTTQSGAFFGAIGSATGHASDDGSFSGRKTGVFGDCKGQC